MRRPLPQRPERLGHLPCCEQTALERETPEAPAVRGGLCDPLRTVGQRGVVVQHQPLKLCRAALQRRTELAQRPVPCPEPRVCSLCCALCCVLCVLCCCGAVWPTLQREHAEGALVDCSADGVAQLAVAQLAPCCIVAPDPRVSFLQRRSCALCWQAHNKHS